jgi:tRNA(fMet)-specific endonuclease VapC
MYLFDTNHCSAAILRDTNLLRRISEVEDSLVATCVIVQGELVDMAERSQRRENNLKLVQLFLQGIYIYDVDAYTATIYGQLKAALFNQFAPKDKSKRRKTKITDLGFDENDLWIAAITLQNNLTIVSSDSDFLRIQQVRTFTLECWF